ncbi:MAG: hydroxymethylglutaryl-CoA reductase (NADPH) [Acidobacteriota bacterium]|nr:hydroxymethylglutaryl-CoA reductase (NADPH) [Acidobacteriota bacterium]
MTETKAAPEDWVQEIAAGRRGFHQLPADLTAVEAADLRRRALEEQSGRSLEHIGHFSFDASRASTRNCENLIGVAQIPMGIVGPVRVRGEVLDDEVFVPMATTEGALLASVNRGCSAIRRAGGAVVHVEDVGMTRAPVFRTSGIEQTNHFLDWVGANFERIRKVAEGTSRFLRLVEIRPRSLGTTVFLRFRFETGDAMGMNMATIACDRVVRELIDPETGVECVALSGNYCVDKKPAAVNFLEGRGKRIFAEVLLEGDPLTKTLKSNAPALVELQYRKNLMGSIAAGSMGYNGQAANVLAGIFAATGQDLAHVVEGSMTITGIEPKGEGVLFSVYMPDVPLAAIGGGTGLETQNEALALMGIEPDASRPGQAAMRLAEIVGAVVLAGEVSLMSALTSQDLAGAHERLGRGEPKS